MPAVLLWAWIVHAMKDDYCCAATCVLLMSRSVELDFDNKSRLQSATGHVHSFF